MTFIFAQRGATSWGFSIGRLYCYVMYPRFWRTSGLRYLLQFGIEEREL